MENNSQYARVGKIFSLKNFNIIKENNIKRESQNSNNELIDGQNESLS